MKKIYFFIFIIFIFNSCGENEKESAQELLKKAENSYETKKYNTAKLQIDSINSLYPAEIETREAASLLFSKIELSEAERNLIYFSNLYSAKEKSLDSLLKKFTLEKDAKFQYIGEYVPKSMVKERYSISSYLKVHVLENGKVFLSCIYCGLDDCLYKSVKVSYDGFFVESSPYKPNQTHNYAYTDDVYYWRTLILKEKESREIINFIDSYAPYKIRVSLIGDYNYSYVLDEKYKLAVKDACFLASLIEETKELKRNISSTKNQIYNAKQKIERQQ